MKSSRRQTELLIPPTQEEINRQADAINLPRREALKFRLHYETVGWRVGKAKMKCWKSALAGWKLRWEERNPGVNGRVNTSQERDRIMKQIEGLC